MATPLTKVDRCLPDRHGIIKAMIAGWRLIGTAREDVKGAVV
jgi:hypothetical protein